MFRLVVSLVAVAGFSWLFYLIYLELRNAHHVWHDPCITPRDVQDEVLLAIRAVREAFAGTGIRWWLDYGTLLGAWRLGRTMPFDHDADLSYLAEDKPLVEKCRDRLAAKGITLNLDHGILFYHGNKVGDLEAWHLFGGVRCREDPATREGLYIVMRPLFDDIPVAWLNPLWQIKFEGDWYPCPNHPERLLRRRYPTCRINLRLCFPHKQRCWFSSDFWKAAWSILWSREGPVLAQPGHADPRP